LSAEGIFGEWDGIMGPLTVLFLFFVTGAVGLAFEVLWIRMLVNIFGTTVYAVSTAIASFFAGLALGSHLFGKIAEKTRNPIRLYGALEFCVGICALLTLVLLSRVNSLWGVVYSIVGGNALFYSFARFALCFSILLVPTTLMGGSLPVLSRYFVKNMKTLGWNLGLIYSVNTFGALVGCFLVGFMLIRTVGVRNTLYMGVACNMIVALTAFVISMREKERGSEAESADETTDDEHRPGQKMLPPRIVKLVLFAFAVSGFASLSYELLWTRVLVYFIGVQTYAYTVMLMAFLFGIALGSIVFARFTDSVRDNVLLFGIVEILIGLSSVAGLFSIGYLAKAMDYLSMSAPMRTWWHYAGIKFLSAVIFMFAPTFLIGSTFPLVSKTFVASLEQVSRSVGKIYALNTVGGIFGSILTGFFLLPLLGIRRSIMLVVSINIGLGLALIMASSRRKCIMGRAANMLGAVSLMPVVYSAATARPILQELNMHREKSTYEILYCKEGLECTLSVLRNRSTGGLELNINGQSTAYTSYRDIQVHKMLAHVPMLMHPDPKEALIVGFGLGCTSYEAALYEKARVTCVELVKDESDVAKHFDDYNKNILANPRFHFVHDDGRTYIQLVDRKYDVISFNAIHPRLSPGLYTREFYQICRNRLEPDGVICAWLPTNWITTKEFRSLVGTFVSVFPDSTFWLCNPDHVLLVGGLKNPGIDFADLKRRMAQPEIREHLRSANLADPLSLVGTLILGPEGLKAYAGDAPMVTDDHSMVEFSRCLDYGLNDAVWAPILNVRQGYFGELMAVIKTSNPEDRKAVYSNLRSLSPSIRAQILSDLKYNNHEEALREYDEALRLAPQNDNIAYWKRQSEVIYGLQK
jgi:spermidine synthase